MHNEIGILITQYGYIATFIGALLEGETAMLLSGFAAHQEYLSFSYVVLIGTLGAITGDQALFFLGRTKGKSFLNRFFKENTKVEWLHDFLEKHQNLSIMLFRFMYGFKMSGAMIIGTSRVSAKRFMILNAIGATAWATLFATLGYLLGTTIGVFLGHVRHFEKYVFVSVAVTGILLYLYRRVWR